jgi:hypothetical protein
MDEKELFFTNDERRDLLVDTGMHAIMVLEHKDLFLAAKMTARDIVKDLTDEQVTRILITIFRENVEYGVKVKHSFFELVDAELKGKCLTCM